METLKFLTQFVREPIKTGALFASSRQLADMVTEGAGVGDARTVVEFGPGSGAITEIILEKLPKEALFFAVEINPGFVKMMRKRYPRVTVYQDSAANTRKYLEEHGRTSCDCIVSGLPWAAFPGELQDALLDAVVDVLEPGGRFATYTYFHAPATPAGKRFRKKLEKRMSVVGTLPLVWQNIPPALVIYARK